MSPGYLAAIIAYFLWGVSPLFWKQLVHVPINEVLGHRVVWSMVFVTLWLIYSQRAAIRSALQMSWKVYLSLGLAAGLLFSNWFMYNWAINHSFVVEASLGYFINPMVNFLLGLFVLKERPRRLQTVSILIAFLGVGLFAFSVGRVPWISLGLAITFGLYGLIKKQTKIDASSGMMLETGWMLVPAIIYFAFLLNQHQLVFAHQDFATDLLLIATGLATVMPLVFFASAAQKISLISMGVLQFMSPSLQFLLGVFVYGESFTQEKLVGFLFIWTGLVLFTYESLRFYNTRHINRERKGQ